MLVTQEELETHQEHKIIELAAVAEELHKLVLNLQLEKVTWCFQLKHYLNHRFFHLAELEKLQVVVADPVALQTAAEHLISILHLQQELTEQVEAEDHVIMLQTQDQQVAMVEFTS
jgi:hypothetical protein